MNIKRDYVFGVRLTLTSNHFLSQNQLISDDFVR